ncbi:thioredoxin family protein [Metabacillus sp. KIGAM252]|uniref:Thioredoxin family protein n=1 Tax=Metabacillus flavus TaxID=2823519 RepID=A0ABS5LI95_9BACI|nr:thioredoxin family protein [Metabacillus flavus]MBS2970438.1 thioredoxin family protein [Metabacillus flavus]
MIEVNEKQISGMMNKGRFTLYLYTPFCGTCQLAKRMLTVVDEALPETDIYMANLNYLPGYAEKWEVESVPCLLVFENGHLKTKQYAFQSVEFLYTLLRKDGA